MSWRFEWLKTWPEVWSDDVQQTWMNLLNQNPHAFIYHQPALVRAYVETIGAALGAVPMVGIAEDVSGQQVLLPWMVVNYKGKLVARRTLEQIGGPFFAYHDPLASAAAVAHIRWDTLWDGVRRTLASRVDQALFHFVHAQFTEGRYVSRCNEIIPVLNLAGFADLEAVLVSCSSNHRSFVRRRMRALMERGNLSFWVANQNDRELVLADFRERFVPAYNTIWRQRSVGSMLDRPAMIDFIQRIITEGLPQGWIHYAVSKVDDTPIAWHLGFFHDNLLYYWIPTYNFEWGQYSPGIVMLAQLIQHGIDHRVSGVHLLTGGPRYKLSWNPQRVDLKIIRWYSPTTKGRRVSFCDASKNFIEESRCRICPRERTIKE